MKTHLEVGRLGAEMGESLKILLVILPVVAAGIALSVTIAAGLLPWAARPLDFGLKVGGQPLFGENKTWRGPLIMLTLSPAVAWLLSLVLLPEHLPRDFAFVAEGAPALAFGLLAGAGYSLGELPNSFLKRRLGVGAGERPSGPFGVLFYFVDQLDSVLGVVLLVWLAYRPSGEALLALFAAGGAVHIVFDVLLYLFGVKKARWSAQGVPTWLICCCQAITYWVCRLAFKVYPGYTTSVAPGFAVRNHQARIIAANHSRAIDPFLATSAIPWAVVRGLFPIRYMTYDGYLVHTWQQALLLPLGCFRVGQDRGRRGLQAAIDFLGRGQAVFIFPEGKRIGDSPGQRTAKVGVAAMALKTGAEVLPLRIAWSDRHGAAPGARRGATIFLDVAHQLAGDRPDGDLQPVADELLRHIYSLGGTAAGGGVGTVA